jgi:N-acetylgalactosamine-6-sulfatase
LRGLAVAALLLLLPSGGSGPLAGSAHGFPDDPVPQWGTPDIPSPPTGPNVVLILADDLGWGDLNCYGNSKILTPALNKLSRHGTLFTQFYAAAPVCSPSRAAFLTGRFPGRLRIHAGLSNDPAYNADRWQDDWLDPAVPTITSIFQSAGYATGLFGKWHLGAVDGAPTPGAYGLDDHVTENSTGPQFPQQVPGNEYFRAESTEYIVDEAIRFIEENQDIPFFVNLWTLIPHATLHPTEEQLAVYDHLAPNGVSHLGARQVYFASVTALDEQIGRLLDRIDELGLANDTIVIFTSDNGPEIIHMNATSHSGVGSPGPFRGKKRSLYEGGVRMPLIVRWPGHVPDDVVDNTSVISAVDLLPTLCALAGLDDLCWDVAFPDGFEHLNAVFELDGEDVSDMLLGSPRARTRSIKWEWRFGPNNARMIDRSPMLAIRSGQWKLLVNPLLTRVELYDVIADPMESDNLADEHPQIVSDLSAELFSWQATLPIGVVYPSGASDYPWPQ